MRHTTTIRDRLSADYQLSLIMLVAVIVLAVVTPFAVFRLFEKNYLVAVADFAMVLVAVSAAVYAWRTGHTRGPGITISVLLSLGAILVAVVLGLDGAFWIYPLIMFVFYLAPPPLALGLTLVAIATLAGQDLYRSGAIFVSPNQMIAFVVTTLTAAFFSFFFARRTNQQHAQLTQWASKDPLTGLYNRRNMEEELRIALATRDRHHLSYGMMILDLDNFKAINDERGHAAGDQILKELATLILSSTRVDDRAFRYGGDEFVVLLPNTDREGLATIARNLVSSIGENLCCAGVPVTASLGAALLTERDDEDSWNRRADRCLYRAKEQGRNIAVLDFEEEDSFQENDQSDKPERIASTDTASGG
jgi:diguanylate cyclase